MNARTQRIIHRIMHFASRVFVRLYVDPGYRARMVAGSARLPEPPYIMVGNHGTFFDPWLMGSRSRRPIYYMCNDDAWRAGKVTQTYLTSIGAYPKKKGGVDYKALKTTLRILDSGSSVCIFPEGQTSWDGETQLIYRGLERLIKKAGTPVVIFNLCGNFLVKPWWARRKRSGRVLISVKVLDSAAIARMGDDELFGTIKAGIYHNDIKDERNRAAPFAGKDVADGVERFVWICMHCGAEDRLVTAGDTITCEACGRAWRLDAHCGLHAAAPDTVTLPDLKDWADMHRAQVIERLSAAGGDTLITHSSGVVLQTVGADGYTFVNRAEGTLALRRDRLSFEPADGRTELSLTLPAAEVKDSVVQKKDLFELRHGERHYRFEFSRHSPMKWVYYVRYLQGYAEFERRGYL